VPPRTPGVRRYGAKALAAAKPMAEASEVLFTICTMKPHGRRHQPGHGAHQQRHQQMGGGHQHIGLDRAEGLGLHTVGHRGQFLGRDLRADRGGQHQQYVLAWPDQNAPLVRPLRAFAKRRCSANADA